MDSDNVSIIPEVFMIYVATAMLILFGILSINHFVFAFLRLVKKKDGFSYVPLVNGLIGMGGFLLYPSETLNSLWWIPFVVDWGCIPLIVESFVHRNRSR